MRNDQVAAGRHRLLQPRHDPPGILGVPDEVQHRHEQDGHGLAEVDDLPECRVREDLARGA